MSEVLTVSAGVTGTTYGTFAGATNYLGASGSESAVAYRGLTDDADRKRKLIDATRYLNRLGWITAYATFAARDALDLGTGDGDTAFPFRAACYELAALAVADADVLVVDDQGSNVRAVGAGSARVEFFSPTSAARGTAPLLPSTVLALIGSYLAVNADALDQDGGTGSTGSCVNPFGACADYDRREPY
jgi:hypothetical protein